MNFRYFAAVDLPVFLWQLDYSDFARKNLIFGVGRFGVSN